MKAAFLFVAIVSALILFACSSEQELTLDIDVEITNPQCTSTALRNVVLDTEGITNAHIIARAGSLRIEGLPGLTEVRVAGVACAPNDKALQGVELIAEKRNDQIFIRTLIEDSNASLEMSLEVPDSLALKVDDSRGDLTIRNVNTLELSDGAGEILVENVAGQAAIKDGSESMTVTNVGGTLTIVDTSGDIVVSNVGQDMVIDDDGGGDMTITDVSGTVLIREDGSGDIDIRNVGKDVIIEDDGGGDIIVSNVEGNFLVREDGGGDIFASEIRGDFTVERDDGGSVTYQGVSGNVSWPAK